MFDPPFDNAQETYDRIKYERNNPIFPHNGTIEFIKDKEYEIWPYSILYDEDFQPGKLFVDNDPKKKMTLYEVVSGRLLKDSFGNYHAFDTFTYLRRARFTGKIVPQKSSTEYLREKCQYGDYGACYDLLQISYGADKEQVKKAYRQLALKYHPDKGGDIDMFKAIQFAYEKISELWNTDFSIF